MIENFHFLRPAWLYMLLPLLVLFVYLCKHHIGSRGWEAVCDKHLWSYILLTKDGNQQYLPKILLGCAGLLTILALAGPAWEQIPQPLFEDQSALVIALDLSPSMDAQDVNPSRLERARFKIIDILNLRSSGQTALLVYADGAYVVAPLTTDNNTINAQLSALTTDIMPSTGNNLSAALSQASALLRQAGMRSGDVLLLTDGVAEQNSQKAVSALLEQGYRLSILGIGTQEGVPIPLAGGGFLQEDNGSILITTYDDALLKQLATLGRGVYQAMSTDDTDIQAIMRTLSTAVPSDKLSENQFQADIWQEQGPWLLLLLLPLAMLTFRRGYLVIVAMLLLPRYSDAMEWQDLWLTRDQQAAQQFEQGDSDQAAKTFDNVEWQAAAHYRAGNFATTVELLDTAEDAQSFYNKANALSQLGRYKEAIHAYNQALELSPSDENAQYNLQLVKDVLEKQSQEGGEQQSQPQEEEGEQQGQPQEGGEQQGQPQEGGEQQGQPQDGGEQQGQPQEDGEQQGQPQDDGEQQGMQQPQDDGEQSQEDGEQQGMQQSQEDGDKPGDQQSDTDMITIDEQTQAIEQWLRRIPDNPGRLLRNKFKYQYKQQEAVKKR